MYWVVELNESDAELLGIIFILLDVVYICHSVICFGSIGYDVWKASRKQITEGNEVVIRTSVVVPISSGTTITNHRFLSQTKGKSVRTLKVEEIEKNHEVHRHNRKKKLEKRQTERRNSVNARLAARKKAKQTNALQKCVIFENLDDASVSTIIDLMEYQVIQKTGTDICKQGEFADVLYLIITGTCKVIRNGEKIAVLTEENGIFGEGALYPDQNGIALRGATVTSMGSEDVQLLCLTKEKFDRLVASNTLNEDCMNKLNKIAEKRAKENNDLEKGKNLVKGGDSEKDNGFVKNELTLENIVVTNDTATAVHVTKEEKVDPPSHIAQIRTLVAGAMKTSARLRKTCTRLNSGDASVSTISRDQFEMLVAHIIKKDKKQKKNTIEIHFFKEETWNFIVGKDKEIPSVSFDQLEKWLFGPLAV